MKNKEVQKLLEEAENKGRKEAFEQSRIVAGEDYWEILKEQILFLENALKTSDIKLTVEERLNSLHALKNLKYSNKI